MQVCVITDSLQIRINASNYLSRIQSKYQLKTVTKAQEIVAKLEQICASLIHSENEINDKLLLDSKHCFAFYWAMMEFSQDFSQADSGRWQAKFADITIQFALKQAWMKLAKKQAVLHALIQEHNANIPGLFILGMGKLGGQDLNFSSDIDLVAFYDADVLPVPDMLGKSYICHQVLQLLSRALNGTTEQDFIWRIDWRLRPNASSTTLAMQTEKACDYYFYRASPWHRLALMKARVVAGDAALAEDFIQELSPFIWRQNLDYRALDELAEIKQKINLEHPALKSERLWRSPIGEDVAGFNVKLGAGGIREIEFVANALQLLWGGKRNRLKTPNTLQALTHLADLGILQRKNAIKLHQAYVFLRTLENAIQLLDNQHSHLVPTQTQMQEKVRIVLQQPSWVDYIKQLNHHRRIVSQHFEALFSEKLNEQGSQIQWPSALSVAAREIVQQWENGFQLYGVSSARRQKLQPLLSSLSHYLNKQADDNIEKPSATILRLHHFFQSLPQGDQYFRLLAESPTLLESIIPPLLYSPPMAKLLQQSPHIIDTYMQQEWEYERDGFDAEMVLFARDYETQLERIRRFVNEYLYQLYLQFLQHSISVETLQCALSDLAEFTINLCLKIVSDELGLGRAPIAVLAMGKLATKKMSPTSDLDLIFIYDADKTDLELAGRFVSRLQTAIATPMREGIVYELDTRLRPSGKSGAPTVSVQSFKEHQLKRAHTWEHIALVPSRVVAGEHALKKAIDDIKRSVLQKNRNHTQFKNDALKMWHRISMHRIKDSSYTKMSNKLIPGGLMQTEYLAACLILSQPRTGELDFAALLQQIMQNDNTKTCNIEKRIQFWSGLQIWERLLAKAEQPLDSIVAPYNEQILQYTQCATLEDLVDKKARYAQASLSAMEEFFIGVDLSGETLQHWKEKPVLWE